MAKIEKVLARRIIDSRGNPTVECDVLLEGGAFGRAAVPSGASTGTYEALELRDGGKSFGGRDVMNAVRNVNEIIRPAVIGMIASNQAAVDRKMIELDGTPNKSKLGANAILAVSLAAAAAAAKYKVQSTKYKAKGLYEHIGELFGNDKFTLPAPMMNIINGGRHASNGLDIQEFMIIPQAGTMAERVRIGAEVFHKLKSILAAAGHSTNVGDEGGFAPDLKSAREALDLIMRASDGHDVKLALDVAASEFAGSTKYKFEGGTFSSDEMIDFYEKLIAEYPIVSIEDGLAEDDWDGWKRLTARIGAKCQLVGDDLFVTNPERLRRGITMGAANAILIKPNQIGTLSETLDTIRTAMDAGFKTIISHRSGETEDTFIADLAVGTNAGQIKTGSMSRTDRTCKYNRLIRIEEELTMDN